MPIRYKIIGIFLLTCLVPNFIIGIILFFETQRTLQNLVTDHMNSIITIQKTAVTVLLDANKRNLNFISNDVDLQTALANYTKVKSAQNLAAVQAAIVDIKIEFSNIEQVQFLDLNGNIIASTQTDQVGTNHVQDQFFQKGTTEDNFSTLYKTADDKVVFYLSKSILVNGKKIGVIALEKKTDDLFKLFSDYTGLGKTGQWGLATHSSSGKVLLIIPGRFSATRPLEISTQTKSSLTPLEVALSGKEGIFTNLINYQGVSVLAVTRYIPQVDWGLAIIIPQSEAFAPVALWTDQILIFWVLVFILVIFMGLLLSEFIANPIKTLLNGANKLKEGDFSVRVNIRSKDEMGELGTVFNMTVKNLKDLYGNLEEKVKEQTKSLTQKVSELENTKTATLNILEDLQAEKIRAEAEEEKDQAILDSIGDSCIVTDNQARILFINQSAREYLHIGSEDVLNKAIFSKFQLFDLKNKPLPYEQMPGYIAIEKKQKVSQDYNFHRDDGATLVVNITATPVTQKNTVVGTIMIFRDITKEKEIDRMKTEFISIASHQLLTPLSAVKWLIGMLLHGDAGELTIEQHELMHNVDQSNQRMIQLVTSMLNISRIESGRILIEPVPSNVKKLCDEIQKELATLLLEKKQQLHVEIQKDLPEINLDPKLINEVFINLLTNAIKYSPENSTIDVSIFEKDGNCVCQVHDNGYGIAEEDKRKIFTKFYRGKNIIKHVTDGTGLGLYLVKLIVESSGGKIWFESEENKGTTFWFSFPMTGMIRQQGEVSINPSPAS